ncbi:MAG: hypothetical protein ABSE16_06050 [Verrucomicrobiota bacterium]|jgi:hypothetical protein
MRESGLDLARLDNVRRLDNGTVHAACPACRAAGSDKTGDHLLIKPDGKFGCAVHPDDRGHRKEIFRLAGKSVSFGTRNGAPAKSKPAFDWQACVAGFTDEHARRLADWRGISAEFFKWLHQQGMIGLYQSKPAFPVHRDGAVIACHWRLADKKWFFYPKGVKVAPLVFGDVRRAGYVMAFESQWDAFAVMDKSGWHNGAGVPDAAVFITRGAGNGELIRGQVSPDAVVYAFTQNDEPDPKTGKKAGEKWLADIVANAGCRVLNVTAPAPHKDANDWIKAGATSADLQAAMKAAKPVEKPQARAADDLQRAIADARPKIRLPGPDRLLSDFADDLVHVLRDEDIFWRNGEIVTLADGELKPMTPQTFRSWAEKFFIGYRAKTVGENSFQFNVTMTDNEARGTLAAPQFADALRRVRRVNHVRLPVFDAGGKLTLLPDGYHEPTQTLTIAAEDYDLQMPLAAGVETINDLLAEFCFADGERSKSVAVAATVGVFASQILPEKSLRPCFVFVANAEGAGKTLLAQICITPTLGIMPLGSKADDDDEMRKVILTAVREGKAVIFLDNIKGRLSSEPLEAFLSAPVWSGRKLGFNESVTGDNLATCFVTGNGMTVSPDMRRRSLFVELHLEAERAEDRQFTRPLDLPTLLEMRPKILAALWAMVREWDAKGRPAPTRGHSAFPSWANMIGGIVESAGFACPLATANVTAAADPDAADMRTLVSAMAEKPVAIAFSELVDLAREHGLFVNIIGIDDGDLDRGQKSALGRLLARYDRRTVLHYRFALDGKGHARRYRVEPLRNDHATEI